MDFNKEFKKYATGHHGLNSMHVGNYIDSSLTPYIIEERQLKCCSDGRFFTLNDGSHHFSGDGYQ